MAMNEHLLCGLSGVSGRPATKWMGTVYRRTGLGTMRKGRTSLFPLGPAHQPNDATPGLSSCSAAFSPAGGRGSPPSRRGTRWPGHSVHGHFQKRLPAPRRSRATPTRPAALFQVRTPEPPPSRLPGVPGEPPLQNTLSFRKLLRFLASAVSLLRSVWRAGDGTRFRSAVSHGE